MPQTVEIQIFKFDELSEQAQQKALENHLNNKYFEYDWTGEISDTLKAFADIFPVKVREWEYTSYSHNVNWSFDFDRLPYYDYETCAKIEEMSGQRLATYIWNNYRRDLFKGKYFSTAGYYDENKKYHYKFRHSKIILDHSCVLTGICFDEDILRPIYEFLAKPDPTKTFSELMGDCFDAWGKAAKNELESQESFEYFKDMAEANEYEFTEDGERWN